jgi:hypothetical protein
MVSDKIADIIGWSIGGAIGLLFMLAMFGGLRAAFGG